MGEAETVARIARARIVAIVRAPDASVAARTAITLVDAGLDVIEVSFNTPDTPAAIAEIVRHRSAATVGAGTVVRADQARAALAAGARFLVAPGMDDGVDAVAREAGALYVPGVFTATEVMAALRRGRDVLKLFPAAALGPDGMRALLEPFPEVRPIPTGGVTPEAAPGWLTAGALAVGLGGALTRAGDPGAAAAAARSAVTTARP